MPLTDSERYFVQTVAEDLKFLQEEWDEAVDDASLRRSSGVLRILLVDDAYGRAWRLMGFSKQPRVTAVSVPALVVRSGRKDLTYVQAGGAKYGGATIGPIMVGSGVQTDADAARIDAFFEAETYMVEFGLREYVDSKCIVAGGPSSVKRREVIQYVANKLGGTHLDTGRGRRQDTSYSLLDRVMAEWQFSGKPAVYFELLAIGQAVAHSSDAAALRRSVEALEP